METNFEVKVPETNYSKTSSTKSAILKNQYGTWILNAVFPENNMLMGTIVLEPIFDETSIDPKLIKINVERKDTQGKDFNSSVAAVHHGRFSFFYGPFPATQNNSYSGEIIANIEMPQGTIKPPAVAVKGAREHWKKLFETGNGADVTIKAEEKELKVHKLILLRSEFFEKLLNDSTEEVLTIEDMKYDVLVEMCRFLYYDNVQNMEELALDLLLAADKFMLHGLAAKSEEFLKSNITMDNYNDILVTADKLNKIALRAAAMDFIIDNRKTIFSLDCWKDLKKTNMPLAMLVMEKFMLSVD